MSHFYHACLDTLRAHRTHHAAEFVYVAVELSKAEGVLLLGVLGVLAVVLLVLTVMGPAEQ